MAAIGCLEASIESLLAAEALAVSVIIA